MRETFKPIVSLGLLAGMAIAAHASINFGSFTGTGTPFLSEDGAGILKFEPNVADSGDGNYSGSFMVTSTTPLESVDVQVGSSLVYRSLLSFNVSLDGGAGFVYSDAVVSDFNGLKADGGTHVLALSYYTVTYDLSYVGHQPDSFTAFTASALNFHAAAVPESASFAPLTLGIAAFAKRRRRAV